MIASVNTRRMSRRTAASSVPQRCGRLEEPVAGLAATGGMQPAPVDATQPGGQAATELATDIGHRRPGERASLLEAKVVNLEPGDLTGVPAANDRLGDLGTCRTALLGGCAGRVHGTSSRESAPNWDAAAMKCTQSDGRHRAARADCRRG